MRRAFSEGLLEIAAKDPRVVFLTGDLGYQVFDEFQTRFPGRYINVGIAEAAMVDAAAGLASEGMRPVVYSIAAFATGRPFEQIRVAIGYARLPVVIVGAGGGYTYAGSGVTHHAAEDLGLMSLIPGLTVVAPADPCEMRQLLPQLLQDDGPSYLRIGRFGEPEIYSEREARLGYAHLLRTGRDICLFTTGDIAHEAVEAVSLLEDDGLSVQHVHIHTVKPLDTSYLDRMAESFSSFVVVEEHLPIGGLASAIYEWRASRREGPLITRLGAPDTLVLGSPPRDELRRRIGIDRDTIAETCRRLVSTKSEGAPV